MLGHLSQRNGRGFLDGVDQIDGGKILAIAAPLLMSLLGKQTGQENSNDASAIGGLMSAFLGKTDTASLIKLLLFGKKKKKGLLGMCGTCLASSFLDGARV